MLDLVKVIQEQSYRDPITSFIEDLYVKFDFDSAQQKLRTSLKIPGMIFEAFCRIHH